ncbi:MAG TPA: HAMP domain-containing sensor histidine kinase [Candidatus Binatia bacterium]|nr:HAMP domain-containing sensor histidine kinase [Candidatus Binatia bacterium]
MTLTNSTGRERAEVVLQQEAQTSATLAWVGRELVASLDTPPLLETICRITTEVLGCDCCHLSLWQPQRDAYVLVAGYGDTREQWETLRAASVPRQAVADLLAHLEREEIIQVLTAAHPTFLPAALLLRAGVTQGLWVALRRGHAIIGGLSPGYRGRTAPFPPQQERIVWGIAQLASLALTNTQFSENLDRVSQLKTDFLATMSHELRTPLSIVIGYIDLLLEEDFGPLTTEQGTPLRRVRKAAYQELELITAMLDVSQLEAGQLPVEVREVEVPELIAELRQEIESAGEKTSLHWEWRVAPELPALYTDRARLKVVLKNLLGNAVKFTDRGSVTVTVQPQKGGLEFCVADTGMGITPEVQAVMFEMFRQGNSALTRRHGGVGLGLYMVKRLLELLGGTVSVESDEMGRGSTFRVWVPSGARSRVVVRKRS